MKYPSLAFLTRCLVLVAIGATLTATPAVADERIGNAAHHIKAIQELYTKVNQTPPSMVNATDHQSIIEDRLMCYSMNKSFSRRLKTCNNEYVKQIVHAAREKIKSRPSVGIFVAQVGLCPILYNICMGKTQNDKDRCITFERQCIDYNLDEHWRGAPQYGQRYYNQ